jgi:hypothetical protein
MLSRATPLLGVALLGGCDDTVFETSHVTEAPPDDYTPDWAGVIALMDDHCLSCHEPDGTNPIWFPDDIELDAANGTGFYVVAGSPDDSKLWRVLSGALGENDYADMPLGSGPLPLEQVLHVKWWIALGAEVE